MAKTETRKGSETKTGGNIVPLASATGEPRASEKVISFVKRHPVITVAGAIVAGVAVSALVPRKASRRVLGKALGLAEAAGAATAVFGASAGETAKHAGRRARKQAPELGDRADKAGHVTAAMLEKYGQAALAAASALGRATAARAHQIGDVTTEQSRKVRAFADDLRDRIAH